MTIYDGPDPKVEPVKPQKKAPTPKLPDPEDGD